MAEYQHLAQRFFFTGISAFPADGLLEGKLPYAKNIRSYQSGVITPRDGLAVRSTTSFGGSIHSLARLNDPTTFNGGSSAVRLIGVSGSLYRGAASGTTYSFLDGGYSGNPLTFMEAQPPQSPRPYLYVGDASRQRKFTTNGSAVPVGIPQPTSPNAAPSVSVAQIKSKRCAATIVSFVPVGTTATAPTTANRVSTTIAQILYDTGTTGYASVVPTSMLNITVGMFLTIGGEQAIVTDLTVAVASTTVGAIIYDAGSTGLCTIQPAGSLGTGQLEAPPISVYRQRAVPIIPGTPAKNVPFGTTELRKPGLVVDPIPADVTENQPTRRIRQVDFPVGSLVKLNGGATVRILSVAVGQDGILSFRCSTATTIAAGQSIVGIAAVRVYLTGTRAAGQAITNVVAQNTLSFPLLPHTSTETITHLTGGIKSETAVNFGLFSDGTAILPDDDIHIAVKVDQLTAVTSLRIYLNVDTIIPFPPVPTMFLQNYFFYEWRANDIITAIQGTNAAVVTPLVDARKTVITNQQLEAVLTNPNIPQSSRDRVARTLGPLVQQDGGGTASAAITSQMALGNNQWLDLHVKVKDLIHVGTDTSKTLADVNAVEFLVAGAAVGVVGGVSIVPTPLTCQYGDIYISGGSGPDVGDVGDPYVYTYRYRSSVTGAVSNPAPPSRGGVIPKRQAVNLVPIGSGDADVDKIDWFKFGGTLTGWTYLGTGANSSATFTDTTEDDGIEGTERLAYDNFQPWPTQDLPRTGSCAVAGTAVSYSGGDTFNTNWAPGTAIIVNGRAATIYGVVSSTLLFTNENLVSGSGVAFSVPGATLVGQPLPAIWGDFQGVYFGCGDPNNPGTLYWSHGNNPEAARDSDTLLVTAPSDPLQAGGIWNTFPFVASTEDLFQIIQNSSTTGSRFRVIKTACGRGFWTRWAWCTGPQGIFFLGPDGIFLSAGGAPAESLTDADLRPIFPKDGIPGVSVNGIPAPDMSQTTRLRLNYIAGMLYFDFVGLDSQNWTLIFDVAAKRWMLDNSALTGIVTRLEEPGASVFDQMIAGVNGVLYQYDPTVQDAGVNIAWEAWTPLVDGGQPRITKQFGDAMVSLNAAGSVAGIGVVPVLNDGNTVLVGTAIGTGQSGRQSYVIELHAGDGAIARNFGLRFSSSMQSSDTARPELFLWESAFLPKSDDIGRRASDWDALGYDGAKFVQGVVITANTYGVDKVITIESDGGVSRVTLTINHDGEVTKEYPQKVQSPPGWPPFVTHMVRIVGADDVPFQLLGYRFVFESAPELATQWETQFTTHDLPGFLSIRDAVIAHESTCPIRLRIVYDAGNAPSYVTQDYDIEPSGGAYKRSYLVIAADKGLAVKYQLRSAAPFRIYKKDCAIRVSGWGSTNSYLQGMPFGGESRASGAEI